MTFVQMVHRLHKIKYLELGLRAYTFSLLTRTGTADMERVLLFNDVIDVKSKILCYTIVKPTGGWRNNDDINTCINYSYSDII